MPTLHVPDIMAAYQENRHPGEEVEDGCDGETP